VTEEKIKPIIKKLEDVRGEMNTVEVMNRRLYTIPFRKCNLITSDAQSFTVSGENHQ